MTTKHNKLISELYMDYYDEYQKKFGKKSLVLMQVGSFYEAYALENRGANLELLEEITDCKVSHKGKDKKIINYSNPKMWGFPMIATTKYVNLLIEDGHTLIMIDQIPDTNPIQRKVIAIHTPSTYISENYKPSSNFISAICFEEILQKNNYIIIFIGMSAIDVSTGEVYIHETKTIENDEKYGLDETIRFVDSLNPKEIIIYKENLKKLTENHIVSYLGLETKFHQFKDINKIHHTLIYQKKLLEKVYNDKTNITDIIDTLNLTEYSYARKTLVNLLTYISDCYEDLVKGLSIPVFFLNNSNLILGNSAISQLNIINENNNSNKEIKYNDLLDVINRAETSMGKRYIKHVISSPFVETEKLNNIYNIVDIFRKDNFYNETTQNLKNIYDISRLYRQLSLGILKPVSIVEFMSSFQEISKLFVVIKNNKELIKYIKTSNIRQPLRELNILLEKYINIEKIKIYNFSEVKENIFNPNIFPELDELQEEINSNHILMDEVLEKLDDIINEQKLEGKKVIVIKHNKQDGHYLLLTTKRFELLKSKVSSITIKNKTINIDDFGIKQISNSTKMTLPFLKNKTKNIDELLEKLINLTKTKYIEFLENIVNIYDKTIKNTIEIITQIDYYNTIAKVSKLYNYIRPIIKNNNSFVDAKNLRHPLVERIITHEYIPHDICIGDENMKGMLIYGLNSSGKSVLMKAVGISIIMAQSGFFVPATEFYYYPYSSLYTRITGNDNLFRGLSSFSLEMVELNAILSRSNNRTLVIGDEVCRGTEHISGNAIVAASLLKLLSLKSTFIFATHLHELMNLDEIKNNNLIKAFHLEVSHDEVKDLLIYDRKLKEGSGEKIYGITVAKYIIKDIEFNNKTLEIKNILINRNEPIMTKKSKYNSKLLINECHICGKKNTKNGLQHETHHINFQINCDDNGFVKNKQHIKKNDIFNLAVLCNICHDKLHNGEITINQKILTSKGEKLM